MSADIFEGIEKRTAAKLTQLCALRGIAARVTWDGTRYLANGEPCGPSVHGVYEWMEKRTKSALEILDASPGGRLFKTPEEVDAHVCAERDDWDSKKAGNP